MAPQWPERDLYSISNNRITIDEGITVSVRIGLRLTTWQLNSAHGVMLMQYLSISCGDGLGAGLARMRAHAGLSSATGNSRVNSTLLTQYLSVSCGDGLGTGLATTRIGLRLVIVRPQSVSFSGERGTCDR